MSPCTVRIIEVSLRGSGCNGCGRESKSSVETQNKNVWEFQSADKDQSFASPPHHLDHLPNTIEEVIDTIGLLRNSQLNGTSANII